MFRVGGQMEILLQGGKKSISFNPVGHRLWIASAIRYEHSLQSLVCFMDTELWTVL